MKIFERQDDLRRVESSMLFTEKKSNEMYIIRHADCVPESANFT